MIESVFKLTYLRLFLIYRIDVFGCVFDCVTSNLAGQKMWLSLAVASLMDSSLAHITQH
jgi:hypothetical protein